MGRIAEALKRAQQQRQQRIAHAVRHLETASGELWPDDSPEVGSTTLPECGGATELPAGETLDTEREPIPPDRLARDLIMGHEQQGELSEQYRSLRTRLLTANTNGRSRIHAVVSTCSGEGRSVTVANLGLCLAELKHLRVAVVDLDFRRTGLSRGIGLAQNPGIAEVVRGERTLMEVCVPVVRHNLHAVPAGNLDGETPGALLGSERLRPVFRELAQRFHYVLVDTPPIRDTADTGLIAPLSHSALLVVQMNHTPEPWIRRSVKTLQSNQIAIEGCILTGWQDETIPALCSENGELSLSAGF
jgi:Mrp family chromosome partitioning ATPase